MTENSFATIPLRTVGPIKFAGGDIEGEVIVPLATYESPLWPSTNRGGKVSRLAGGIAATMVQDFMTRSIVVQAESAAVAYKISQEIKAKHANITEIIASTSNYARLENLSTHILGNLLYVRIGICSGDASGHNMVTAAAEAVQNWLLQQYPKLHYVSISANCCTDKKVSAINGILGRGKNVIAEITVPAKVCAEVLKTTPERVVELHIKKNLLGSNLAGGLRSANAHFANVLLGFYLATGQDAANIVEGSQGIVHAEVVDTNLYFSVTMPNIIVGTVGNGKDLPFVQEHLKSMGCLNLPPGRGAKRLALICAGAVLCGELSLLAAQTNPGELMRTHFHMERQAKTLA